MILVPATPQRLHPRVIPALLEHGYSCIVRNVNGRPRAYGGMLHAMWLDAYKFFDRTFYVIEHDVEIVDDVIKEMRECSEPWCVNPYPKDERGWGPGDDHMIGCAKFNVDTLGRFPLPDYPHWLRLAEDMWEALTAKGFAPHVHHARIIHHHIF